MQIQVLSMAVLVAIFAFATWRSVHMGALALAAALVVGPMVASESIKEVLAGFPVDILLLLLGVSLLFGIARSNGALEWLVGKAVRVVGSRSAALPVLFFLLAAGISSLGSPLAAIIINPFGISIAGRHRLSPVVIALAGATGTAAGAFAPTSLFGLLTVRIAERNGIDLNPFVLFGAAAAINAILFVVAWRLFRNTLVDEAAAAMEADGQTAVSAPITAPTTVPTEDTPADGGGIGLRTDVAREVAVPERMTHYQWATVGCVALLVFSVIGLTFAGLKVDIGAVSLSLAMTLALIYSRQTAVALTQIDWSTILLVGGIVTYVGILDRIGAIDTIARLGVQIPVALVAALILCLSAAAISSVGSTTGLLPIIMPLAIPLAMSGTLPAAGVVCALAISSALVDVSPYSTAGAAWISAAPSALRPGLRTMLLRWGLSMIVVGPVLTCAVLIAPWT